MMLSSIKMNKLTNKWSQDLNRHFSKERNTGGQEALKKKFNIANYCGNANQNYNETSPHISQKG